MDENEDAPGAGTYMGECHGGPWDTRVVTARRPNGFLLVDKPGNRAWVYDWNGDAFICREPVGDELDFDRRMKAAEDPDWDVMSYDGSAA